MMEGRLESLRLDGGSERSEVGPWHGLGVSFGAVREHGQGTPTA